jgi:hypothetical protein
MLSVATHLDFHQAHKTEITQYNQLRGLRTDMFIHLYVESDGQNSNRGFIDYQTFKTLQEAVEYSHNNNYAHLLLEITDGEVTTVLDRTHKL